MYDRCCGSCCISGMQGCGCSWCYITADGCIRTDSAWVTFINVIIGTLVLSSIYDFYWLWAIAGFMHDSGGEPQVPGIIEDRDSLSNKEWEFFLQPRWSWNAAFWEACLPKQLQSTEACVSVFCICCGTVVCNAQWYRSDVGEQRCTLVSVLWWARRAKHGIWPENFAQLRSPLMILTAASAWPLLLGFHSALVSWASFQSIINSANNAFSNCGPLSLCRNSGIPCSANDYLMIDIVFEALHWDARVLQTIGVLE